jgi:hypothetical protein
MDRKDRIGLVAAVFVIGVCGVLWIGSMVVIIHFVTKYW